MYGFHLAYFTQNILWTSISEVFTFEQINRDKQKKELLKNVTSIHSLIQPFSQELIKTPMNVVKDVVCTVTGEKPPDKSPPVKSLGFKPGAFHRGATVPGAFHLEPVCTTSAGTIFHRNTRLTPTVLLLISDLHTDINQWQGGYERQTSTPWIP